MKMYDKERIKELCLGVPGAGGMSCELKPTISDCSKLSCVECVSKKNNQHADMIVKMEEFICRDCETVRKKLNINYSSCDDCKPIIIEFITQDFKKVFNELKVN